MRSDSTLNCIPVICGSGRSGTTWVQDVIAQSNGLRTAFEPLHPVAIPEMRGYANKFIAFDEKHQLLESYLRDVFEGNIRHLWTEFRVRPDRLVPLPRNVFGFRKLHEFIARWRKYFRQRSLYIKDRGSPVITKFIRANLMYPWLFENFDIRLIHVIRHPCAVIYSKLRLGGDDWDVDDELSCYLDQRAVREWVQQYIEEIEINALNTAGKYAVIWCIENKFALKAKDERVFKVYFEELANHDEVVWAKLCSHLGLTEKPGSELLGRPSQQARPENRNTEHGSIMLSKWRDRLDGTTLGDIEFVLKKFNISDYSINRKEPVVSD